jgi:hypothetical protein
MTEATDTASAAETAGTTSAAEATTASPPKPKPKRCFPDDPYYPNGYTEIDLPPERLLRATFNAEILEPKGEPQPNIIQADEPFTVRFRVALEGELWYCICGDWWFDLGFAPTGKGEGFDLSDVLGRDKFYIRKWRGCDTRCLELVVYVPPDTIPVEYCGTVYQCAAKVQLFCCGRPAAVVGFDVLGSFQFYKADVADDSQK